MPLQETKLAFRLAGGVDLKSDPKTVAAVRLLDLQNGVFAKGGTIRKRNGYRALGQTIDGTVTAYADARQLGQRDDELVLFTDDRALSYRPSADVWSDTGHVRSSAPTETPLVRTGSHQTTGDEATAGGISVLAWEDSRGGVYWTVLETATDRVLVAPRVLDVLGERPRCVAVGGVLHVYYAIAAQGRIKRAIVNPARPTVLGAATILLEDLAIGNPTYDACSTTFNAGAPALIVWARTGGGYRIGFVHASGVLGSPVTGLPTVATWADVVTGAVSCAYTRALTADGGMRAFLDFALGGEPLNSTALAMHVGAGGDVITLALVDDLTGTAITYTEVGAAITIHYAPSGTTVAQLLAIVAAQSTLITLTTIASPTDVIVAGNAIGPTNLHGGVDGLAGLGLAGVAWAATNSDPELHARITLAATLDSEIRSATIATLDEPAQRVTCAWSQQASPAGNTRLYVCGDSFDAGDGLALNMAIYPAWYSTAGDIGASPTHYQRGLGLASRLVGTDTGVFVLGVYATTLFGSYFTLELYDATAAGDIGVYTAARHLCGSAAGLPPRTHLPVFDGLSAIAPYRDEAPGLVGKFGETGIARIDVDVNDDQSWQSGQLGRCLYLGGGVVQQYDGRRWAEAGFHYAADDVSTPTQTMGGALTVVGVYGWVIVYEEVNAQGEVDRGPTSIPIDVTLTGSNDKVTFKIPTYRLTGRDHARIGVFRSKANDSSIFYRVTSLDPSSSGDNRYIGNDPNIDFVLWTDSMSDAIAADNEELYTTGGVLSNDPPTSGRALAVGRDRLFFSDPFDPNLVRYSQTLSNDGSFGAELADSLAIRLPPYGGPVTGLAIMDDTLIVFRTSAVYFVAGVGPDANPADGSNNAFSDPALITTDVGCARPTSVGATPVGLLFQSAKGVYLLGRDRQVTYVGAPVEALNGQTVRRSILLPDRTQILLVCDTGRTLLYDYYFQQWSTFTNHEGLGAAVLGESVYYLRTDGRVFAETPGVYRDDNSNIPLVIVTAWLHFLEQLQGMQHIYHLYLLGTWRSPHVLQVDYQIDYKPGWNVPAFLDETHTSTDPVELELNGTYYGDGAYGDGPYGGIAASPYEWRVHLGQPIESIRFRFRDNEPTGLYGASYELTELQLTGGVMANSRRPTPAIRSA